MIYRIYFKRIFDILITVILLVVLFPIWLMVMLLLTISNNGTPFFVQSRPGKHGKMFYIIKFKSMNDRRDQKGELLPDNLRLTPVGLFIRNTSLDELPQLLNVLKGDMSLIGPRPLMESYLPLYNKSQQRRHNVLPGITGWAQVKGRNAISWERKFEYDVWYVDNISFLIDIKILLLTILKVFKLDGINQEGVLNPEPFKGVK
jgi:undecaprenyl phosphate N,N'-diacetylbacillosamine 1-phosphate transferase|tara:strand:- start:691 stop:1299 length:609 start_codon:yes stop_codon:yes gene_type:complete